MQSIVDFQVRELVLMMVDRSSKPGRQKFNYFLEISVFDDPYQLSTVTTHRFYVSTGFDASQYI